MLLQDPLRSTGQGTVPVSACPPACSTNEGRSSTFRRQGFGGGGSLGASL